MAGEQAACGRGKQISDCFVLVFTLSPSLTRQNQMVQPLTLLPSGKTPWHWARAHLPYPISLFSPGPTKVGGQVPLSCQYVKTWKEKPYYPKKIWEPPNFPLFSLATSLRRVNHGEKSNFISRRIRKRMPQALESLGTPERALGIPNSIPN